MVKNNIKVLFIVSQLPYPLDAGSKIRGYNLLSAYSIKNEVTLVSYIFNRQELEFQKHLHKFIKNIYTVPFKSKEKKIGRIRNLFLSLFSPFPLALNYSFSTDLRNLIQKLVKNEQFDIIHLQGFQLYKNISFLLRNRSKAKKIFLLDLDDYESKKCWQQLKTISFSKEKILLFLEFLKIKLVELLLLCRFDHYYICPENSKYKNNDVGLTKKVVTIPNGVDIEEFKVNKMNERENTILYLGALSYEPNVDAVLFFCKSIFPHIKSSIPEVKFIIAGKNPPPEILDLHDGKNVLVKGYIDDVKEILNESSVVVVPLRIGGGTRIKILESLALEKAVVSTSIGCEGLLVTNRENIIIEDDSSKFAAECIDLLTNKNKRQLLGKRGRELVENRYNWKDIRQNLSDHIDIWSRNISEEV